MVPDDIEWEVYIPTKKGTKIAISDLTKTYVRRVLPEKGKGCYKYLPNDYVEQEAGK